ncbi:MAG TPA: hypothetical protein VK497_01430 [Candidatus Saccharimonadales bacterium]|nr:hypothetical protein [Candidatus Saccharimonadales bacterium]
MGFLDGLGRFMEGKDPFEGAPQPDAPQIPTSDARSEEPPLVDEHGNKIVPRITLDNVKAHRDGGTMTVMAWVTNHSERPVRIDYFSVLGQKQTYQYDIAPSRPSQLTIYKGAVASNEHDSHAEFAFRIKRNDDGFKNVYHVEFNRESDGKFTIEELHADGPVRDI